MPVALRIPAAFETFKIVVVFILAAFTKSVKRLSWIFPRILMRGVFNVRAAFFTLERALSALKDFTHHENLALSDQGCLLFPGILQFFIKGYYIGHETPSDPFRRKSSDKGFEFANRWKKMGFKKPAAPDFF